MIRFCHLRLRAEATLDSLALGRIAALILLWSLIVLFTGPAAGKMIADSGQSACYDNSHEIACPRPGQPFYGQDAQYRGNSPRYRDNNDGTVTDLNTGLMWSKGLDGHKVTPEKGEALAAKLTLGGYSDWRVPTIKELYSLIDFRGNTGFHRRNDYQQVPADAIPFINTDAFDFAFGDVEMGERYIDAQWLSATKYVSATMGDMETAFGVNFADGRIKGYGYRKRGMARVIKTFYIRYVRGPVYGRNDFIDSGDGTVTDRSTGLMWTKADSGRAMTWQQALAYAEGMTLAGHDDWRLPNAKELQYIVDYSRSPDTTGSPAIDPIFETTAITNEAGQRDYPFFWTSTTHLEGPRPGASAAYVAFGRALGKMRGRIMDVHGAGAQRSDPKSGSGGMGHGPQGDARRVQNYVRCVRGGAAAASAPVITDRNSYPNRVRLVEIEHDPNLVLGHEARKQQNGAGGGAGGQGMNQGMRPGMGRMQGSSGGQEWQGMQGGKGMRGGFVQHLDRDGDGQVSRAEFDGPPDRFDFHDVNRDGYITEDEAPQGPPPGRGQQGRKP